jgi:hypothetical protein
MMVSPSVAFFMKIFDPDYDGLRSVAETATEEEIRAADEPRDAELELDGRRRSDAGHEYFLDFAKGLYPTGTKMRCPRCGGTIDAPTGVLATCFEMAQFPPPCPSCHALLRLADRADEEPATLSFTQRREDAKGAGQGIEKCKLQIANCKLTDE